MARNRAISVIESFHDNNLHLPSRTVYFGNTANVDSNEAEEVNSITVGQVIKNLHILDYLDDISPIALWMNTPGGYWDDGIAVYDVIKAIKSKVIIIGAGKIYSMGSIILQAGHKRLLLPNSTVMIHDGWDGYGGDAKSFESWAENSKKRRQAMYEIYYEQMKKKDSKITYKKIEEMCSHDRIFSADEAVEIGLADEKIETIRRP